MDQVQNQAATPAEPSSVKSIVDQLNDILQVEYFNYDPKFKRMMTGLLRGAKLESRHFTGTNTIVAVIRLDNGVTVDGSSSCIDPARFDYKIGEYFAIKAALEKLDLLVTWLVKSGWERTDDPGEPEELIEDIPAEIVEKPESPEPMEDSGPFPVPEPEQPIAE